MTVHEYRPGDWVVVRKQKQSNSPGPRAKDTVAAPKGETYVYIVEKFWVVENVTDNGELQLVTRRGKRHTIPMNDRRIRKANWWDRFWHRARFEAVEEAIGSGEDSSRGGDDSV